VQGGWAWVVWVADGVGMRISSHPERLAAFAVCQGHVGMQPSCHEKLTGSEDDFGIPAAQNSWHFVLGATVTHSMGTPISHAVAS
jgi:hypothetical protein